MLPNVHVPDKYARVKHTVTQSYHESPLDIRGIKY